MMKYSRTLALSALILPAIFAFNPTATTISFTPKEGSSLTKKFTSTMELTMENMDMTVGGQPPPVSPEVDMQTDFEQVIVVTDTYVKIEDGTPTTLQRSYDELGWETDIKAETKVMGQTTDQSTALKGASELEGKAVEFSWDAESEEYKRAYHEDEGEEELLENLKEDMDLRALLPTSEVSEGDSWEIDVSKLTAVLAPGGDLAILPEDLGEEGGDPMMSAGMGGSMSDMIGEFLEGEATGTFKGLKEVDDVQVAIIAVVIDIDSATDLTEKVEEILADSDMPPEVSEIEISRIDLELEFEAEGTLLWNVAAGHVHSFELSGESRVVMDIGMTVNAMGQELDIEQNIEMSGTMTIGVEVQ